VVVLGAGSAMTAMNNASKRAAPTAENRQLERTRSRENRCTAPEYDV
jgi:hypothetical protein